MTLGGGLATGRDLLLETRYTADSGDEIWILFAGFFGGLYAIYWGFRRWKLKRLIQDTPTEKVRSMAAGRTELEGTVREHDGTVDPPFASDPCIYVNWKAERRERHTDSDGNTHYRWETVASGTDAVPFDLEDDTGRALIRADRDDPMVDINDDSHRWTQTYHKGENPPQAVEAYVSRGNVETGGEGDDGDDGFLGNAVETMNDVFDGQSPLQDTGHRRRYKQQVLPVGSNVYVFGGAQSRQGASMAEGQQDLLEIRRHDGTDEFLISDSDEEELQQTYGRRGPIAVVGGLLVSAVCLYFLLVIFF